MLRGTLKEDIDVLIAVLQKVQVVGCYAGCGLLVLKVKAHTFLKKSIIYHSKCHNISEDK